MPTLATEGGRKNAQLKGLSNAVYPIVFFKKREENLYNYFDEHDLDTYRTLSFSVYPLTEQNTLSLMKCCLEEFFLRKDSCLACSSQGVIVLDKKRNVVSKN